MQLAMSRSYVFLFTGKAHLTASETSWHSGSSVLSAASSRLSADSLKIQHDLNREESQSQRCFGVFLFGWFWWGLWGLFLSFVVFVLFWSFAKKK